MAKKIIYQVTIGKDKNPVTWELRQERVMANKEGKGMKFIGYYPGEDSCFVEDHRDKDIQPVKVPLFEYNGLRKKTELSVDSNNLSLINYLETHPEYGVTFSVFSKEIEAKKSISLHDKIEKALDLLKQSDDFKTQAVGFVVLGFAAVSKSLVEIKAEVKSMAISNPDVVIRAIEADNYENKFISALAFAHNIIKTNRMGTAVVWNDAEEGILTHIATGENGIDKLGSFLRDNLDKSQGILHEIDRRINLKNKVSVKEEAPSSDNGVEVSSELEEVQAKYKEVFDKEVPVRYKNDIEWLQNKIDAELVS